MVCECDTSNNWIGTAGACVCDANKFYIEENSVCVCMGVR